MPGRPLKIILLVKILRCRAGPFPFPFALPPRVSVSDLSGTLRATGKPAVPVVRLGAANDARVALDRPAWLRPARGRDGPASALACLTSARKCSGRSTPNAVTRRAWSSLIDGMSSSAKIKRDPVVSRERRLRRQAARSSSTSLRGRGCLAYPVPRPYLLDTTLPSSPG